MDVASLLQRSLGSAFRIERELSPGGMSRVFVALDTSLDRRVVVKVLAPELMATLSVERFRREVQLLARLQHPHVVPILAAGVIAEEQLPYYLMPYVEGESLRERLTRGRVPADEAATILRDVARALAFAHARGVIHRDIKPENILLSGNAAVVADFGIAKALSASTTLATGHSRDGLTTVGVSVGTPAYMSPEQALGGEVDSRTDLYAWGIVGYEMLAGAHPYASGGSARQLVAAHLASEPPPLREVALHAPDALVELITRCLAKEPHGRPTSAEQLLAELSLPLGRTTGGARGGAGARAWRAVATRPLAAIAAVVVLLAAGGGLATRATLAGRTPAEAPAEERALAVLPIVNLSGDVDEAYFSDGLTEDLILNLSRVEGLRVISRTSVMRYKGTTKSIPEIARELGVRYVLEASVRREGNQVRINAQLIDATNDAPLWTQRFDRQMTGVFALQGEIAARIGDALEQRFSPEHRLRLAGAGTENLRAYDLLLRGREYLRRPGVGDLTKYEMATTLFRQALALDAEYARAYAGLAESFRRNVALPAGTVGRDSMLHYARRAVELDPHLAEGAAELGFAYMVAGRLADAEREFRRALEIDLNHSEAIAGLASLAAVRGQLGDAVRWQRRAVRVDPVAPQRLYMYGSYLFDIGDLAGARRQLERAITLAPDYPEPAYLAALLHLVTGDTARAEERMRQLAAVAPAHAGTHFSSARFAAHLERFDEAERILAGSTASASPAVQVFRALVALRSGDTTRSRELFEGPRRMLEHWRRADVAVPPRALLYGAVIGGEPDRVLEVLRTYWRSGLRWIDNPPEVGIYWIEHDPAFAELRDDPRLHALLREIRTELDRVRESLAAEEGRGA